MKTQKITQCLLLIGGFLFGAHSIAQSNASSSTCGASFSSSSSSSSTVLSPVQCAITSSNAWGQSYQMEVNVTNTGVTPLSAWDVQLALPPGQSITSSWNAVLNPTGQIVAVTNANWNGQLQPGQSTSFGVVASYSGTFVQPVCTTQGVDDGVNEPPQIDFSVDLHGPTIFVDARDSIDPDGDRLSYSIDFGDGKIINSSTAWHTYRVGGDYTVTVTAKDKEFTEAKSQVINATNYVSGNKAPIAKMSLYSSRGNYGANTGLTFDEDGDELIFTWEKTHPSPGYAFYVLTVSDGTLGDTVQGGIGFGCNTYYDPRPYVEFSYRVEGLKVIVDARDTTDANRLNWSFGDGAAGSTLIASHTYAAAGTYDITLTGHGTPFSNWKTVSVNVGDDANNAPQAKIYCVEKASAPGDYWTHCNSVDTFDPDSDDLTLLWDMGDGNTYTTTSIAEAVSHQYVAAGRYEVRLTANDSELSASTLRPIYSNGKKQQSENTPPVACFTIHQPTVFPPSMSGLFDASCSTDADGDSLTYAWQFTDGSVATGVSKTHTFATAGTQGATLTVSDGTASHSATRSAQFGSNTPSGPATCKYIVTDQWSTGFTGVVRITNVSAAAIEGWSVNWQYSGNNRVSSAWNASVTGTNPFVATNLGWNKTIAPGQNLEIGFQGSKSSGVAEVPVVVGSICQ